MPILLLTHDARVVTDIGGIAVEVDSLQIIHNLSCYKQHLSDSLAK